MSTHTFDPHAGFGHLVNDTDGGGNTPTPPGGIPGNVNISNGQTVELPMTTLDQATFLPGGFGTLQLDGTAPFSGLIAGFDVGDRIDLRDIVFQNDTVATFHQDNALGGTLTITEGGATVALALTGNYTGVAFAAASDGHGGTLIMEKPQAAAPVPDYVDPGTHHMDRLNGTTGNVATGPNGLFAIGNADNTPSTNQPPGGIPGNVNIYTGQTVELPLSTLDQVTFAPGSFFDTLKLDGTSNFTGDIVGFTYTDRIDLANVAFESNTVASFHQDNGFGGTLSVTEGSTSVDLTLMGNYTASAFAAASDGHGGTLIMEHPQAVVAVPVAAPH